MDDNFLEELIRIEAEELATETLEMDYCQLSPRYRYVLRVLVIDRLELGNWNFEDTELTVSIATDLKSGCSESIF